MAKLKEKSSLYGKFYSPEKILSYGRPFMLSVGSRSIGKSTAWGMVLIKDYIKNGHMFIYTRRTKQELSKTCKIYFNNAIKILQQHGYKIADFKYHGGEYYIMMEGGDWELCGYALELSQEKDAKSGNYSAVWWILYDEFILKNTVGYLSTKENITYEYTLLTSLHQTVDRDVGRPFRNECRVVCLGNLYSFYNPLFLALEIDKYPIETSDYIAPKGELWVLEQTDTVEATEEYENSWAFKLSSGNEKGTDFNNIAKDSKEAFVGKVTGNRTLLYNLTYAGRRMSVWQMNETRRLYISYDKANGMNFALTIGDQNRINFVLASDPHSCFAIKTLKKYVSNGFVDYQTARIKYDINRFLRFMQ